MDDLPPPNPMADAQARIAAEERTTARAKERGAALLRAVMQADEAELPEAVRVARTELMKVN